MSRIIARTGINRRMAMKAIAAMGLSASALTGEPTPAGLAAKPGAGPAGTLTDPDLVNPEIPWERTLSKEALETLAAMVDLILPADERSPSASELGAYDFIDEWVSAPYPTQQEHRAILMAGLDWLEKACDRDFGKPFSQLSSEQQRTICDQICHLPDAAEENMVGAAFFSLVRNGAAAAVWTTNEGMADLGYVGNVPLARWDPPPANVLKHLGLES
jgi:hypothetical protein